MSTKPTEIKYCDHPGCDIRWLPEDNTGTRCAICEKDICQWHKYSIILEAPFIHINVSHNICPTCYSDIKCVEINQRKQITSNMFVKFLKHLHKSLKENQ